MSYLLKWDSMHIPDMKNNRLFSELFADAPTRTFKKRSVLFDSNSEIDGLYMMIEGSIKVTMHSGDEESELLLNNIGPGDPLPLPLYFGMQRPKVRYIADTNVTAVWRSREEVEAYFESRPEELRALIRLIFTVMYGRVNTLAHNSAEDKVLQRLIELSERWGDPDEDKFEIKTTQQELADSVGLSRESVNQMLNKLEEKGIVTTSRNRIFMSKEMARAEAVGRLKCAP